MEHEVHPWAGARMQSANARIAKLNLKQDFPVAGQAAPECRKRIARGHRIGWPRKPPFKRRQAIFS